MAKDAVGVCALKFDAYCMGRIIGIHSIQYKERVRKKQICGLIIRIIIH